MIELQELHPAAFAFIPAVPVLAAISADTLALRILSPKNAKPAAFTALSMNLVSGCAIILAAPLIAGAWSALPGMVLENPIHRWYASGKLHPYTDAVMIGTFAILATFVELFILKLRKVGIDKKLMVTLLILNIGVCVLTAWWPAFLASIG
ncbi:MAG: hypothetical protein AAGB34_00375 [Planctomycetota bacterium]